MNDGEAPISTGQPSPGPHITPNQSPKLPDPHSVAKENGTELLPSKSSIQI